MKLRFLAAGLLSSVCALAAAPLQGAAQNKVIVKRFNWKVARTQHFDIYHIPGSEKLLEPTAKILEEAYARITGPLGVQIPKRSAFYLYLNHNEFEQNNIVDVGEGTGGVTEAFKDRFLVFNDGSRTWLEHVVFHEFVHVCQFRVLYAGFWKSARLLKSVLYPLWFMEGSAEYFSAHRDEPQKEMVIRDAVTSKSLIPLRLLHGFNHVKPHQVTLAYKTGCAAMEYIAREYGEEKIGLLLKSVTDKFDINGALHEVLGISLTELDEKFVEDLEERYEEETKGLNEPSFYGQPLAPLDPIYPVFSAQPAFFPNGESLAFIGDKNGFDDIYRHDFADRRAVPLDIQKRWSHKLEAIRRDNSALSISPDGKKILFAGEHKQRDHLYIYDIARDRLRLLKIALDGVKSPQFFSNGKKIAFIGMKDGLNDLYICDIEGRNLRQLKQTEEDEGDLRIFPDGITLLFSREKLAEGEPGHMERDLWTHNAVTGAETQITRMPGNETQPSIDSKGREILFVGDGTGRFEIYRMESGKEPAQLTRSIGGSFQPTYHPKQDLFVFTGFRKGQQQIYLTPARTAPAASTAQDLMEQIRARAEVKSTVETYAALASTWSITQPVRKYRFRASTDFFFPVFFYSSTDGLFFSAYWQASEMLGNHQLQTAVTYASALDFLNYQVLYSYLRFRPQFFVGVQGDTQENVFVTTRERRREDAQFVGITYPLNRFDSLTTRFLTTQRNVQYTDDDFVALRAVGRENVAGLSFVRNISQGRYLETTSGYRFSINGEESDDALGSTLDYRNLFWDYNHFVPAPSEGTVAFRLMGGASFGSDKQFFRTGGSDLLRGYERFSLQNASSRFAIANLEYRFPIVLNANTHIWFLFPDFLFKNVYGHIFMDQGILWEHAPDLARQQLKDIKHSIGVGLRFQAFVLQTFPISIQADYARRTVDGEQVFYLGFGPHF